MSAQLINKTGDSLVAYQHLSKFQNLEIIPFYDDELQVVRDDNNEGWISVKRLCNTLGIDFKSQLRKVSEDPRFKCRHMATVGQDDKVRESIVLSIDDVHYWLASINVKKMSLRDGETEDELVARKDKLIAYQRECGQALRDYWMHGLAINRRNPEESMVIQAVLRDFRTKSRQALIDGVKEFIIYAATYSIKYEHDAVYYGILNLISGRILGRKFLHEDEQLSGTDMKVVQSLERLAATVLMHYVAWARDPKDILDKMAVHFESFLKGNPLPIKDVDVLSVELFEDFENDMLV